MEEDRSGDHITPELGLGRKSDALSPIFMGKLPPVPKEENLWGSRSKRRKKGESGSWGSLGARHSACQIDGGKHVGLAAATGCREERS